MPLIVEHCLIHPYLSVCGCVSASSFRTTMCLLKGIVMPLFVEHCMIHPYLSGCGCVCVLAAFAPRCACSKEFPCCYL